MIIEEGISGSYSGHFVKFDHIISEEIE